MEKVKVVKAVPGILKVGDILISPQIGADFQLTETEFTQTGESERFISLDYVTVSENIPQFFRLEENDFENESECYFCGECTECDCKCTPQDLIELDIQLPGYVVRTPDEIAARYDFFEKKFFEAYPGSESQIVYKNLMWFIEWLEGKAEVI